MIQDLDVTMRFLECTLLSRFILWWLITVGGVMAFLTLHEMLPLAFDYAGQKQSVKAVFLGMAFMSARSESHFWWNSFSRAEDIFSFIIAT